MPCMHAWHVHMQGFGRHSCALHLRRALAINECSADAIVDELQHVIPVSPICIAPLPSPQPCFHGYDTRNRPPAKKQLINLLDETQQAKIPCRKSTAPISKPKTAEADIKAIGKGTVPRSIIKQQWLHIPEGKTSDALHRFADR